MALVIIDMQTTFEGTEKANEGVVSLIKRARKNKEYIFVVMFKFCGPLRSSVKRALKGYPKLIYVRKDEADGSGDIVHQFIKRGFNARHLVFCGVWTSQCVKQTFLGMVKRYKNTNTRLTLVPEGCGDISMYYNDTFIKEIARRVQRNPRARVTKLAKL